MRRRVEIRHPVIFKGSRPRVGILMLSDAGRGRRHEPTYGLRAVCEELSVNVVRDVAPDTMDECDTVLCSLCSPTDALRLAAAVYERPAARLVVGGQGAYPFLSWRHLTHRIAFGRAERAVDACVLDSAPLPWCYDYDSDPGAGRVYEIRQARALLPGEVSVGCCGACKFCQYRATRRAFSGRSEYSPGLQGYAVSEDRWQHVASKPGRQTTALDGLSESTRRRVGKPVADEQIVETLSRILAETDGVATLKIFQIVGYPWETLESVTEDVLALRRTLGRVRPGDGRSRIMAMITTTPFSPEPLTRMEDEPANIETRWRDVLLSDDLRCVFDAPHLNAFFLPQIPGPLRLYQRVAVNRGLEIDALRVVAAAETIDEAIAAGGDIHVRGAGLRVSRQLRQERTP